MTSLIFRNFYFDYYSYVFRLAFKLRLRLGLGLELGFLAFIMKCLRARNMRQAFSLDSQTTYNITKLDHILHKIKYICIVIYSGIISTGNIVVTNFVFLLNLSLF